MAAVTLKIIEIKTYPRVISVLRLFVAADEN